MGGPEHAEIHSSAKALVGSPAWRLVQALSSLVDSSGDVILVPGYYDDVRGPTREEETLLNAAEGRHARREAAVMETLGVRRWIGDVRGVDSLLASL